MAHLHIYPDGTGKDRGRGCLAWGFHVIAEDMAGGMHFAGFLTGPVATHPEFLPKMAPTNVYITTQIGLLPNSHDGPVAADSGVAEQVALLWALVWRSKSHIHVPTTFYPDSLGTLQRATGTHRPKIPTQLTTLLRTVALSARFIFNPGDQHVFPHWGTLQ